MQQQKLRNSPDGFPDPLDLLGRDSLCNAHGGDTPRLGDDHVRGGSVSVLHHLVQHQLGNLRGCWFTGLVTLTTDWVSCTYRTDQTDRHLDQIMYILARRNELLCTICLVQIQPWKIMACVYRS